MFTAVVARPPVFGGKVVKVDARETLKIAGVKAVEQVPSGVAVIADRFLAGEIGARQTESRMGSGTQRESVHRADAPRFFGDGEEPGAIAKKTGDPAAALESAAKTISAEYDVPYLAHAMMEPLNCVVDLRADSCEIWTGTQFETVDRAAAAKVAGSPRKKCRFTPRCSAEDSAGARIRTPTLWWKRCTWPRWPRLR